MDEFLRALAPVKRRIRRNRMLRGAAFGLAAGMAGALILLLVSRFVMIPDAKIGAGIIPAAAAILCAAGNALRGVSSREAAVRADGCGLQERAVTALDTIPAEAEDGMRRALREAQMKDACEALNNLDPKRIRAGSVFRYLLAAGIGCVLCAVMLLVPNTLDRRAEEIRALQVRLNRLAADVEEAAKQDESGMTEAEKQELRKLTADLKRELSESRDEADALVAADRAEKRLEQMRSVTAGDVREAMEAARALADALGSAGLESLAQAVSSGDAQALAQALAGMSAAEAEALSQAAEALSGAAEEAAEAMASGMESGDAQQAAENALNALQQAQAGGSAGASAMQQALQNLKASLSGSSGSAGNQGSAGQSGMSGNSGRNGSGSGSGAGTGSGSGQKQDGGNESRSNSPSGRPVSDPKYREEQYEPIYDPEKAEAAFRDVTTEQRRLGEDSVQIEAGEGKGTVDGSVPYGQVIGEYARTETQSAESEHLTGEQREWVSEYFRLLTGEQDNSGQ